MKIALGIMSLSSVFFSISFYCILLFMMGVKLNKNKRQTAREQKSVIYSLKCSFYNQQSIDIRTWISYRIRVCKFLKLNHRAIPDVSKNWCLNKGKEKKTPSENSLVCFCWTLANIFCSTRILHEFGWKLILVFWS